MANDKTNQNAAKTEPEAEVGAQPETTVESAPKMVKIRIPRTKADQEAVFDSVNN